MKEKLYFHYISRTLVSFCIFILTGRLTDVIFRALSAEETVTELFVFLVGSGCAILTFRFFERLIPAPVERHPRPLKGRFYPRQCSPGRYAAHAVPTTVVVFALLVLSMYLVTMAFDSDSGGLTHSAHTIAGAISMLVLHPIGEELLFRGLYYGELRSMSPIFACLMQAVMFAISHNGVGGIMYALIAGVLLGTAAERTDGIAVPIAAHILINLRTFLAEGLLSRFSEAEGILTAVDLVIFLLGLLALAVLVLLSKKFPLGRCVEQSREEANELREEANFED